MASNSSPNGGSSIIAIPTTRSRVRKSITNGSLVNGAEIPIYWNTTNYDALGNMPSQTFTVTKAGIYLIGVNLKFAQSSGTGSFTLALCISGWQASTVYCESSATGARATITDAIACVADNLIYFTVQADGVVTPTCTGSMFIMEETPTY